MFKFVIRSAVVAAAIGLAATGTAASAATESVAPRACANFGCEGHNPNIQSWNGTAVTMAENPLSRCSSSSIYLELRYGVTDGDPYSWARVHWISGGAPECSGGSVWVDRQSRGSGATESGLGKHDLLQSGWHSLSTTYYTSWSGMYFNSSAFTMRACVKLGGTTNCTSWY